jgi:hypothetical protein
VGAGFQQMLLLAKFLIDKLLGQHSKMSRAQTPSATTPKGIMLHGEVV